MTPRSARALLAKLLLCGASVAFVGSYLVVALLRLSYPFDLEWMEGGSVDHVVRLLTGQPLYVAPQVGFIPYEYPPLYFWLSSVIARVTGVGYLPLRLVSLVASVAMFWLIARLVRLETRRWWPGLLAVGLFAATFKVSGAWFDLARVDSLMVALFLWGLLLVREQPGDRRHVAAGLVWTAAFLTKQPALAMAAPVVLLELVTSPRRGAWLAGTLGVGVAATSWLLHRSTGGWFTFYVWAYPFKHAITERAWWTFWTRDLFTPLPLATVGALGWLGLLLRHRRRDAWFWGAVAVGMVGAALRSRLQSGGYDNVLMPAYAVVAILASMLVVAAVEGESPVEGARATRPWFAPLVAALCLVQFVQLVYDPRALVPRERDRQAGGAMLARLARVDGPILLPYHGFYSTAAGKGMTAHLMQVYDILKVGDAHSAALSADFQRAIRAQAFGAIVLDDTRVYYFMDAVNEAYELRDRLFDEPGIALPVTGGIITRPELLYLPRKRVPSDAGRSVTDVVNERLSSQGLVSPVPVIK